MSTVLAARNKKGLTQAELARRAGVSQGSISTLERMVDPNPSWDTAWRIARALGVHPTALFPVPEPAQIEVSR